MTKQNVITWALLMALTIAAGIASSLSIAYIAPIIIAFAALKFIGVAFNFMEIKKANIFWQVLIVSFVFIFCGIIIILLLPN